MIVSAYSTLIFTSIFSQASSYSFLAYKLSKDFKNYVLNVQSECFDNTLEAFSEVREIIDDINGINSSTFAIAMIHSVVGYSSFFHGVLTSSESTPPVVQLLLLFGFVSSAGGFIFAAEANSQVSKVCSKIIFL